MTEKAVAQGRKRARAKLAHIKTVLNQTKRWTICESGTDISSRGSRVATLQSNDKAFGQLSAEYPPSIVPLMPPRKPA
ncbi:hypothetical protein Hypma_000995 [Hypsizygus marmoreus]|uniref:Uncharacterized protein n=1 Tax=Hypsizygus marmoreus TaxID=39966 RepID=A0A369J601_HYPMA|nr:hypothetical protein Hypma_000995 [Hypsizygus marmoreus]